MQSEHDLLGSSNEANATTPAAPPAAPSGLSASAASSSQINLVWMDNATNETGYKVERKTGTAGTWGQIGTAGASATSYPDTTCSPSTTYHYRVRATNSAGDSALRTRRTRPRRRLL
ncbi:MAG: fibronectin type III domain-containing protein [Holophagales bacterium]|nr:fibronectin type III domain-containing protein [Holophagales bacterium]